MYSSNSGFRAPAIPLTELPAPPNIKSKLQFYAITFPTVCFKHFLDAIALVESGRKGWTEKKKKRKEKEKYEGPR